MNLTIVVPNRDRLDFTQPASQFFLKSLQWQSNLEFTLLVIDGGSSNYNHIKKYLEDNAKFETKVIQHKIGQVFHKTLLNNIAIRKANTEYVGTTDADMLFYPSFINTVKKYLAQDNFIESRTMYLKQPTVEKLYKGDINLYNIEKIKEGKIKKRSTCGGFACMSKSQWEKIKAYSEDMVGWGSEDYDLYLRASSMLKTVWLGESTESIMLFHQPHNKTSEQIRKDLECQEVNKKMLGRVNNDIVNPNGWGGISNG